MLMSREIQFLSIAFTQVSDCTIRALPLSLTLKSGQYGMPFCGSSNICIFEACAAAP